MLFGSIGIALAGAIGIHALLPALGGAALRTLGEAVKPRVPDDVQKHPLYFLWQLQQPALARRPGHAGEPAADRSAVAAAAYGS